MRVMKTFDLPTLCISAAVPERTIVNYLNLLQRAKYVRIVERGSRTTGRVSVYRLMRNTGPKSPTTHYADRKRYIVDPNTGKRTDVSPGVTSLWRKSTDANVDGGVG